MTFSVVARPRLRRSPVLMGVVAGVAFLAGIVNGAAVVAFPQGAGWESLYSVGLTIDLIVMAVILGAATVITVLRRRALAALDVPVPEQQPLVIRGDGSPAGDPLPPRPSVLATVGLVFIAATWVSWLAFSATSVAYAMIAGFRFQYMSAVGAIFFFGLLWVLGVVFGAIGYHRGGDRRNRLYSALAVGFGLLLAVPVVGFAIVYGLGLSD